MLPPGSSVHGILQARILEWVAMPSSRGSSRPRDRTHVYCVCCSGRILYTWGQSLEENKCKLPRVPSVWCHTGLAEFLQQQVVIALMKCCLPGKLITQCPRFLQGTAYVGTFCLAYTRIGKLVITLFAQTIWVQLPTFLSMAAAGTLTVQAPGSQPCRRPFLRIAV